MLIFITGFMGSGKSHLLSVWSEQFDGPSLDFDDEIAQRAGIKNSELGSWIKEKGWPAFRSLERELLRDSLKLEKGLFSLGGGTLHENSDLCPLIDKAGSRVWLNTSVDTCWKRAGHDSNRPLVKEGRESFNKLFADRLGLYKSAGISISGEGDAPSFNEFCKKYTDLLKID